jgi:hypothetical protein
MLNIDTMLCCIPLSFSMFDASSLFSLFVFLPSFLLVLSS